VVVTVVGEEVVVVVSVNEPEEEGEDEVIRYHSSAGVVE